MRDLKLVFDYAIDNKIMIAATTLGMFIGAFLGVFVDWNGEVAEI